MTFTFFFRKAVMFFLQEGEEDCWSPEIGREERRGERGEEERERERRSGGRSREEQFGSPERSNCLDLSLSFSFE